MDYDVKDLELAKPGRLRIEWAETSMPVLRLVRKRFTKERPLRGIRIAGVAGAIISLRAHEGISPELVGVLCHGLSCAARATACRRTWP